MISQLFGGLSQVCWLFAQLPQVWTNYRLKSVEGLALPFLINWLAGDITNLIGCLLTNQLPFQRNLAIYFNLIDLVLLYQFISYSRSASFDRGYFPISGQQAQVAALEDIAEENTSPVTDQRPPSSARTAHQVLKLASTDALANTFHDYPHNALPQSSLSTLQMHISQASKPQETHLRRCHAINPEDPGSSLAKPLRLFTAPEPIVSASGDQTFYQAAVSAASSQPGRRRTTGSGVPLFVVSLGALAFLSFSTASLVPSAQTPTTNPLARAWEDAKVHPTQIHWIKSLGVRSVGAAGAQPSWQARVGQYSAWICASLYVTSRLPQIFKNYQRKSVEGLSIMLFMMAFLGNLTYVISVLASSSMQSEPGYLRRSTPYLVGSGGTLCFDLAIYIQSRLYQVPQAMNSTKIKDNFRLSTESILIHTDASRPGSSSTEP